LEGEHETDKSLFRIYNAPAFHHFLFGYAYLLEKSTLDYNPVPVFRVAVCSLPS
jgi:hypothetical protein